MTKNERRLRPALMTSVAMLGVVMGSTAAHAESSSPVTTARLDISGLEDTRHQTSALDFKTAEERARNAVSTSFETYVGQITVEDRPDIVISQPGTPTTARDPVNINGIGQMIISTPGSTPGSVSLGLCTGSLINPRTA